MNCQDRSCAYSEHACETASWLAISGSRDHPVGRSEPRSPRRARRDWWERTPRTPKGGWRTAVSTALPKEGRICVVTSKSRDRMLQRQRR